MKKTLSIIVWLALLLQSVFPIGVMALNDNGQKRLDEANREIGETLGYSNYYTPMNKDHKPLNDAYIDNGWIAPEYPAIVYGTEKDASAAANAGADKKGSEYRCIGFAVDGDLFSNPDFPADFAMSKYADTKVLVPKPWTKQEKISLVGRMLHGTPAVFDADALQDEIQSPSLYRRSIALGIGLQYGIYYNQSLKGKSAEELQKACSTLIRGYKGNMVSGKFIDPDMHWEEYCHIIQPPTQKSWGAGILFHENGGKYYYFDVLLPPLELTPTDDLSVKAVTVPTETGLRLKAEVTLEVDSTYKTDQNTVYKWEVLNSKTGAPVEGVTYSGKATAPEGRLAITPIKGLSDDDGGAEIPEEPQLVKATFTMPDSNVIIRFRINNLEHFLRLISHR